MHEKGGPVSKSGPGPKAKADRKWTKKSTVVLVLFIVAVVVLLESHLLEKLNCLVL
jgi:hypothetical protein